MYLADLEKEKMQNKSFPRVSLEGSKVQIGEKPASFEIDFKEITAKTIYLNQKKYVFTKNLSYSEAKRIIEDTFRGSKQSSVFEILISKAYADGLVVNALKSTVALVMSRSFAAEVSYSGSFALEETILRSYQLESDLLMKLDKENLRKSSSIPEKFDFRADFLSVPTFSCNKTKLHQVRIDSQIFLGQKKEIPAPFATLTLNEDNSYSVEMPLFRCQMHADAKGIVIRSQPRCLKVGESIFQDPFYEFSKTAEACCQKEGCAEKVKEGLKEIVNEHLVRHKEFKSKNGVQ